MIILQRLYELRDSRYAAFQAKLTPSVDASKFIGVRVPEIRKLAKELADSDESREFLISLPHGTYDENMLHGALVSQIGDYRTALNEVDMFLPYVDNWAVCDTMSPKVFIKNRDSLIDKIKEWVSSPLPYTCRFGIKMLMSHYLDGDFKPQYLEIPMSVHSDEYYVKMMVAWFFATGLSKQWNSTIPYIENSRLDGWTHNKTIQKATESYRITGEQKKMLRGMKQPR